MLNGITPNSPVLEELHALPEEFHLTGSRAFGMETNESDYDFFTAESQEVMAKLSNMGFEMAEGDYIETTWEHPAARIHVQTVRDVEMKRIIQDTLMTLEFRALLYGLKKIDRRALWQLLNEVADRARIKGLCETGPAT